MKSKSDRENRESGGVGDGIHVLNGWSGAVSLKDSTCINPGGDHAARGCWGQACGPRGQHAQRPETGGVSRGRGARWDITDPAGALGSVLTWLVVQVSRKPVEAE